MMPVLIIRHVEHEGPGYLTEVLSRANIPMLNLNIDKGEEIPGNVREISGLVLMGGPMSVNDSLDWIKDEIHLVKLAIANNIPVLGHCLGGQIIARALNAVVRKNSVSEIGWHVVKMVGNPVAESWLTGFDEEIPLFHWHSETFDLPLDAIPILTSKYCKNQGFVYGKTLALQCHIEMTEKMVSAWCDINKASLKVSDSVQSAFDMQAGLDEKIKNLNQIAEKIYSTWIKGLI